MVYYKLECIKICEEKETYMLNAEKIRLMTDLAIYEKKNDEKVFKINDYYKGDYISGHLIWAFIRYSLCFAFMLVAAFFLDFAGIFQLLNREGTGEVIEKLIMFYFGGLLIYLFVAYRVSASRYKKAKRGVLLYATKLKRLGRKYSTGGRKRP